MFTIIEHLLDSVFDSFLVVGVCLFFGWIVLGALLSWRSDQGGSMVILFGIACLVLAVSDYYAISVVLGSLWGFLMMGGLDGNARSFAEYIEETCTKDNLISDNELDKQIGKAEAEMATLRDLAEQRKYVNPEAFAPQIAAKQEELDNLTKQRKKLGKDLIEIAGILECAERNLVKYRLLPSVLTVILWVSLAGFALLLSSPFGQDLLTGGYLSRREEEELIIFGIMVVLFAGLCGGLYRYGWKGGRELGRETGLAYCLGIAERSWQDHNSQIMMRLKHDLAKPNQVRNIILSVVMTLFSLVSAMELVD